MTGRIIHQDKTPRVHIFCAVCSVKFVLSSAEFAKRTKAAKMALTCSRSCAGKLRERIRAPITQAQRKAVRAGL